MPTLANSRECMMRNIPIFNKLFVTFSAFALLPVVLIGIASIFISNRMMYHSLESKMKESAAQTGIVADAKLKEMKYVSESFSSNSKVKYLLRLPMSYESIMMLDEELQKLSSLTSKRGYIVTLCGNNGQIYLNWNSDGMIYRDSLIRKIKAMPYFRKLEDSRSLPVWVPFSLTVKGQGYQGKVLTLARNITNDVLEGEEELGFVIVNISSAKISEVLDGSTEKILIMDSESVISMSRNSDEIGMKIKNISLENHKLQKIKFEEQQYLCYVRENQEGGLYTVVLMPAQKIVQQTIRSIFMICSSVGLLIVIVFLAANMVSQSLSRPIRKLECSMKCVQDGQLKRTDSETEIMEIRSLANNFNLMVERIDLLIREKVLQEKQRRELEVANANAELKFLRAQIMPHFLFNTLNSIRWLAVINQDTPVEEMITALGRLLECSMQKGNDFIPLKEELENVRAYLKIQEMRIGSKVRIEYEIEEGLETCIVPKLILQPLVENAMIHGINRIEKEGILYIRAYCRQEKLMIEVEDNGRGILHMLGLEESNIRAEEVKPMNGIGILNTAKRIRLIYGEQYGLFYKSGKQNQGTIAVIILKREVQDDEGDHGR